jgi:hypothetical protein
MRGILVALLCLASSWACAAAPSRALPGLQLTLESASLRTIAGWLREHGREGYIGADVADAMGIPRLRGEPLLAARQRGFKSDEVLRIAQVSGAPDGEFLLFMVQRPDDQVFFYLSTPLGGLQKAFVSIPSQNKVLPLERPEAEQRFRHEVLYWTDRSGAR